MRWLVVALIPASLLAQDATLDRARQVNLERAAHMSNFVADEVAKRYTGKQGSSKWKYLDTVETEITVKGIEITREHWRRNGKPVKEDIDGMPTTGFGAALTPLFDRGCPTTLEFADREELRGARVSVYRFRSPADGCFGNLYSRWAYNAARKGRVVVDESNGEIMQFEEQAIDFPKGFGFLERDQVMHWDTVKIGDASHWLPVGADFVWRFAGGGLVRTTVEYKNHRHFETESNVSFK